MSTTGTVTAVSKSVIEVMFDDLPPAVGEVVLIDALKAKLVTETILEDGTVLCLNVENNTSIVRGMEVTATGGGLRASWVASVPPDFVPHGTWRL